MLNSVIIMGRLTEPPRPRFTTEGKEISSFSLAVTGYDDKRTIYVDCQAFGKTAAFVNKYCVKGMRIVVQGRLDCGSYDTVDNNGNKTRRYFSRVIVNGCDFADAKKADAAPDQKPAEAPTAAPAGGKEKFMDIPDNAEDLPFN